MGTCSEQSVKLDSLPGVWRAGDRRSVSEHGNFSTGFKELDECLPGGGWPLGGLTEILSRRNGSGELRLLLPALVRLSLRKGWISWVAPPHVPYAPALAAQGIRLSRMVVVRPRSMRDALWAAEQTLRQGAPSATLLWLEGGDEKALRRLQLAAAESGSWGIVFRPQQYARTSSPSMLRLAVDTEDDALRVRILKCRGGRPVEELHLSDHARFRARCQVMGDDLASNAFTNL